MGVCSTDWGTLGTWAGVGVVALVGYFQYQIFRRQSAIQRDAVDASRFDRRFSVYERTLHLISFAMTVHNKLDLAAPEVRDFWNARDEAKFLFGPTVIAGLDEIEIKLRKMFVAANRQNPTDAIEQELNELRGWFMLRPSSLPELFAEMKLGAQPL